MIETFARHRVAANLLMVMMMLAGFWAIRSMPSQLDPPADFPMVFVDVDWVGASAEDVEALVTVPIEQQLRTVTGLHEITSRTENGSTSIRVEFDYDADMTIGLDQVKQRVANIRNLPPDIEPPRVHRFIDLEPVALLEVTGKGDLAELIPLVRGFERELMSRGIEGVRYDGLPKEEIALMVGGKRLEELGMTLDELAAAVSKASRDVPAGTVGQGQGSRQLRSLDQQRHVYGFEQLLLESGDQLIRLGDLGRVVRRPERGQPIVTKNGRPAIEMMLWRSTEADAYTAEKVVRQWLADVQPALPDGVTVGMSQDIWRLLGAQLDLVLNNAFSGLVLVAAMLFAFLSGRVGWWIMAGIPVSFLMALAGFHLVFGQGISIIALIGFVMALGIVVDDAIVVGEDAATLHQAGASPMEAAVGSARRMWVPVVTSSMTTLAAFIPLLLFGGPMGQIILTLPTVLLCIILASLAECFLVLPAHLKKSLGRPALRVEGAWRGRFDRAFERFRDRRFMPLVRRALDYPGATLCAALGGLMIVMSLLASQHVGVNLVTGFDIESLEANVAFSATATDAQKQRFMKQLETELGAVDTETGHANLLGWVDRQNLANINDDRMIGEQYASIEANYAYEEDRTVAPKDFVQRWRSRIQRPAYVEQLVIEVSGGQNNGQADMSLRLSGDDLESVKAGAEELATALSAYPGVSNVVDNLPYGKEQIIFQVTPAGRSLGLSPETIGAQLRAAYSGSRVQIFNEDDSEVEVRVMLPDRERDDLGHLEQFPIRTADGGFVPLGNVGRPVQPPRHRSDPAYRWSPVSERQRRRGPQRRQCVVDHPRGRGRRAAGHPAPARPDVRPRRQVPGRPDHARHHGHRLAAHAGAHLPDPHLGVRILPVAAGHHDGDPVRSHRRGARPLDHRLGHRRHVAARVLLAHWRGGERRHRADQLPEAPRGGRRGAQARSRAGGPLALPRRAADLAHHHRRAAAIDVRHIEPRVLHGAHCRHPVLRSRALHLAGAAGDSSPDPVAGRPAQHRRAARRPRDPRRASLPVRRSFVMTALNFLPSRLWPTSPRGRRAAAGAAILAGATLTSVSIFATGPAPKPEPVTEKAWPVSVVEAEPKTQSPSFTAYGKVESSRVAHITTDLVAEVKAVHVREGDWMAAGDLLIELNDDETSLALAEREADLAQAEAQLQSIESERAMLERTLAAARSMNRVAQDKLARHKELKQSQLISQSLLDEVVSQANKAAIDLEDHERRLADLPNRIAAQKALVKKCHALLDGARLDVAKTRITAPFAGPVLAVNVAPGDRSSLNTDLVEMADSGQLRDPRAGAGRLRARFQQDLTAGRQSPPPCGTVRSWT